MSKRRIIGTLAVGIIVSVVVAQFTIASADPPTGPVPATSNTVTLTASPVTNLTSGQVVTLTVTTSGTAKLVGNLSAHLCKHGSTSYTGGTFGYDGQSASRCVYSGNIVSGGLTGGDYEKTYGPYSGGESTSGSLTFKAATGTVTWGTDDGFGPFTLTASSTSQVDLVIQVNLSGDTTPVTYFIQPLSFAASGTTTTTTISTTSTSTTTTTVPGGGGNTIGSCTGLQLLGKVTPPLPAAATTVVVALKSANLGTSIYGAGLLASPPVVTDGGASCSLLGASLTNVVASAKLSGVASCNSASASSSLHPLNGKFKLSYVGGANGTLQAYVRVTGFDPSAPDVIDLFGMVTKGDGVGATLSGNTFFDPVVKAGKGDPTGVVKGAYYFDVSQIGTSCAAGGKPIATVYVGDGTSLLGSSADGISFNF